MHMTLGEFRRLTAEQPDTLVVFAAANGNARYQVTGVELCPQADTPHVAVEFYDPA